MNILSKLRRWSVDEPLVAIGLLLGYLSVILDIMSKKYSKAKKQRIVQDTFLTIVFMAFLILLWSF
jgi:hypothetical protein